MSHSTKVQNIDKEYYQDALIHFMRTDPIMADLLVCALNDPNPLRDIEKNKPTNYFQDILSSIVSQQLSVKAAATIWNRFVSTFAIEGFDAKSIKEINLEDFRKVGLSRQKASYVIAVAEAVNNRQVDLKALDKLNNDEVIRALTQLKGVGIWTAEMFLIFSLARRDVFSAGDYGLVKAIQKNYKVEPDKVVVSEIALKWTPFRTAASLALWHSLDNTPM